MHVVHDTEHALQRNTAVLQAANNQRAAAMETTLHNITMIHVTAILTHSLEERENYGTLQEAETCDEG